MTIDEVMQEMCGDLRIRKNDRRGEVTRYVMVIGRESRGMLKNEKICEGKEMY